MKFSLSWLKEYLDTEASLEEISIKLTAIGLEIEDIEDRAKAMEGFVVGHVVAAEKHPDADKLQCLVVDTGTEKLNVVCGAPNAKKGMKGVFAPVGSYIPGLDVVLKKGNIRGKDSFGMMCSEKELLLSDSHEGVIELPEEAPIGVAAAKILGLDDPIIEINLTPNRGDCAGIYGVARDLAAAGLGTLKPLKEEVVKGIFENPVSISLSNKDACPHFIGRYIKGVKNEPSPQWLQDRLRSIGQNPISTLVDITNYFTIAFNRPLHVFDADKLSGNIDVRFARSGEKLAALDDQEYDLSDGMIAICDDSGVIGLGGIIGGTSTAVDENTKNVYLECAYFDPTTIAKTGQKLKIESDARYRFERGIDPAFSDKGAEMATAMILDLCGGTASENFVAGKAPDITHTISYKPEIFEKISGYVIEELRQKEILESLGFELSGWDIKTPSWRHDLDGTPDIVEELLRIDGYDNIPATPFLRAPDQALVVKDLLQQRVIDTRRLLATRGLSETITYSFMESDKSDLFGVNDNGYKESLTLVNPISADFAVMRPSLLPNLIDAVGRNIDRGYPDISLFEVGGVYKTPEHDGQLTVAAGLRSGNFEARHWSQEARAADVMDVKADVVAILKTCGLNTDSLQISTDAPHWYHPGRSGVIRLGKTVIAYFGEIHPSILSTLKRDENYLGFEVFLDHLPKSKKKSTTKPLLKPSLFQPLSRDFAFLVNIDVEAEKLARAIKGVDKNLITEVEIFDVYTGKGVDDGKKSVALAVTLQPVKKTMTDEEITTLSTKIIESVEKKTGGVLRG